MKTIGIPGIPGIPGGMSRQSSAIHCRLLNEGAHIARGGLHSAEPVLHSAGFAPLPDGAALHVRQALRQALA